MKRVKVRKTRVRSQFPIEEGCEVQIGEMAALALGSHDSSE